ncbi:hypothetical protein ACLOJK_016758 [Asimina triloba]
MFLAKHGKDGTPKAANKLKDDRPKADEESEGDTPEGVKTKDGIADAGGKLKVNTAKTGLQGVKSKDEVADSGGKFKVIPCNCHSIGQLKKKPEASSDSLYKHSKITPFERRRESSSGKPAVDLGKLSSKSLNDRTELGGKLKTGGAAIGRISEDDAPKDANKPKDGSNSHKSKDDRRKADEESEGDASDDDGKSIDDLADAGGELRVNPPETGGKPKEFKRDLPGWRRCCRGTQRRECPIVDGRRCFSMGSFEYMMDNISKLQVAIKP